MNPVQCAIHNTLAWIAAFARDCPQMTAGDAFAKFKPWQSIEQASLAGRLLTESDIVVIPRDHFTPFET